MAHVVTCFLRHGGRVLLTRRSDAVGTYRGRWAGVSGYVEGDPADAETDARREIREETGLTDAAVTLVRAGDPLELDDDGREWTVHPFLFDASTRELDANEELRAVEWVHPPAVRDRETVPGLWETYRRVAPDVAAVRDDDTHGSAYVSLRALEVLRDTAATADDYEAVAAVARTLRDARPSMAAVANRINRAMADAERTPASVRESACAVLDAAVDADDAAAARAVDLLSGPVATLSRSGTVEAALLAADARVVVAESRPAREGVTTAERLAAAGRDVTLTTDAALPSLLVDEGVETVLVGADAVLSDGSVVNKVGTRALALSAARDGVDVYAVAARDKVRPDDAWDAEPGDSAAVYAGEATIDVRNPTFDRTPADVVDGVVTEAGVFDARDVRVAATELARLAAWDE